MRDSIGLEPVTTSRSGGLVKIVSKGRYSAAICSWIRLPRVTPAMVWRGRGGGSHPPPGTQKITTHSALGAQNAVSGMLLTRAHVHCADPSASFGPASRALCSRTPISMPHVGVGDGDFLVKEPVGGLQLRLVVGRADHGHDVVAGAVSPVEGGTGGLVQAHRVHLGAVAE